MSNLEYRIMVLEAENKELRHLWIETEGSVISLKVRLDNMTGRLVIPDWVAV